MVISFTIKAMSIAVTRTTATTANVNYKALTFVADVFLPKDASKDFGMLVSIEEGSNTDSISAGVMYLKAKIGINAVICIPVN